MNLKTQKFTIWLMCLLFLGGVTFSRSFEVLCVGSDGRLEFEAVNHECCAESENYYEYTSPDSPTAEHDDCSNCSDVDIDTPLWSKRLQKNDYEQTLKSPIVPMSIAVYNLVLYKQTSIYNSKYTKTIYQSSPPDLLSSAILLC